MFVFYKSPLQGRRKPDLFLCTCSAKQWKWNSWKVVQLCWSNLGATQMQI